MTTALAPLAWDDLTLEQCFTLLHSTDVEVDAGVDLLDADLNYVRPLELKVDGADVQWTGADTIHRSCDVTLALTAGLQWRTALLRVWQTLTDTRSGLSARRNLGVFCPHTPDRVVGETVELDDGQVGVEYAISGQDRLYLLDRQLGRSYVVDDGAVVLDAVAQVFTDAGLTGVLIDGSAAGKTVPTGQPMTWPLLSSFAPGSNGNTADTGGAYTWLRVVNDLLKLVNYRGVWCDQDGLYRCGPNVEPADAPIANTFDASDERTSTVEPLRTRSQDQYQAPNKWIFTRSNMASGVPPVDGAGLYIQQNDDDGPSSINQSGGAPRGVWPTQVQFEAVDQATLVALGNAQIAADKRATATLKISTAPYPCAGHYDVFNYIDPDLGPVPVRVQATEWRVPLDGSAVEWTLQEV